MITLPLFLVDIDFSKPLIWNGNSLEISSFSYQEINTRIKNLKLNRTKLSVSIQKVRLDLGQIRKFDIFKTEYAVRFVEKEILTLLPFISYLEGSVSNIDVRVKNYLSLLDNISTLYNKFKGEGDPIIADIESGTGKLVVFKKRMALITPVISSVEAKAITLEAKLKKLDRRLRTCNNELHALNNSIENISEINFSLTRVETELEILQVLIKSKLLKNKTNLDYLSSKLCDLSLAFLLLYDSLATIISDLQKSYTDSLKMAEVLATNSKSIETISVSLNELKIFYIDADNRLKSIENYLTSFIIGGDNIYLDFGVDYTVVHATPPRFPPCLDPDPCPKGPIVIHTTAPPTIPPVTEKPTKKPKIPLSSVPPPVGLSVCNAQSTDYLGCFVLYFSVDYNPIYEANVSSELGTFQVIDNQIFFLECYADEEGQAEAYTLADTAFTNANVTLDKLKLLYSETPDLIYPIVQAVEITDRTKCSQLDTTYIYEA